MLNLIVIDLIDNLFNINQYCIDSIQLHNRLLNIPENTLFNGKII